MNNHSPCRFIPILMSCILFVASLTIGCGDKKYDMAPVSGRVTVDNKPLEEITVSFQPIATSNNSSNAGIGSIGVTDASGCFTLKTIDGKQGAVVGMHVVRLYVPDRFQPAANSDLRTGPLPYNPFPPEAYKGGLRFEVSAADANQANFDY